MNYSENKHSMKMLDIFRVPVYSFKFKDHDKFKDSWTKFIDEYEYKNIQKHFSITDANLHKRELFNPLRVFFLECMYSALNDIGFTTDIGITSMWATKQIRDNYHHSHTHGNTLFAGVYYLGTDSEKASPTVFENPISDLINFVRMRPLKKDRVSSSYDHQYNEEFEEGKLVIFPGWLRHHVKNNKNENRQIIGFNTMPIGITKRDRFDRYNYQDFRNLPMHLDELDHEQAEEYKY